jgi:ABC-2 type transport system ATP-binding protein
VSDLAVEVVDLVKTYPGRGANAPVHALTGVTFAATQGQVTALLGPNGAGKTTTVEICEGFRRADSGRVRVLDTDPATGGTALRARVGVMLQSGGVYPGAKTGEMLRHIASLHRNPMDPQGLLERLGLVEQINRPYRRLSGGEQQRLSLAMAVIGRPEMVFLDEPTSGLDVQARRDTWQLIRDLRRDGVSVLLTTHAMDEAERLADDVVIINRGQVVATGTPADLTAGGGTPGLRFQAPAGLDLASLAADLPAGTPVTEPEPGHYLVSAAVDPSLLAAVTAWCARRGVLATDLSTGARTLEEVFVELTGSTS